MHLPSLKKPSEEKKIALPKIPFNKYTILLPLLIIISARNFYHMLIVEDINKVAKSYSKLFESTVEETESTGNNVIKVGIHDALPGLGKYNETTKSYYGFEVDLAKEIVKELGYNKIYFVPVSTENRVQKLLNDEVDFVAASCTIVDNPPMGIAFSNPYLKKRGRIITMSSSLIYKLVQLDEKKMGVLVNSVNAKQSRDYLFKRNIRPIFQTYPTYDKLFNALFEGEIDSLAVDESILNSYEFDELQQTYGINVPFNEFEYGIMLKENSDLIYEINTALSTIKSNGNLMEIREKWNE